jgi:TonB family protein
MLPHPLSRSAPGANDPSLLPDLAHLLTQHAAAGFPADLALDLVLNELVVRAADATHATAAALALLRGDQMVCRAATGRHAPDLGTPLDTSDGLSGACLRARAPQLSTDTESDPRVDPTISRRLGIRSMLIVPVFECEVNGESDRTPSGKPNGEFTRKLAGDFDGKSIGKFDGELTGELGGEFGTEFSEELDDKLSGQLQGKARAGRAPLLTGVLEVFSPLPNTFSHHTQTLLAHFAEEIARICRVAAQLSTHPPAAIFPLDEDPISSDEDLISSDTENTDASAAMTSAGHISTDKIARGAAAGALADATSTEAIATGLAAAYAQFSQRGRSLANHKEDPKLQDDHKKDDHRKYSHKEDDEGVASTLEPELLPSATVASSSTSAGRASSSASSLANRAPLALSRPYRQPYEVWTLTLGALVILAAAAFSFMIGSRIGWLHSPQQSTPSASAPGDAPASAAPATASIPFNKDSSKPKSALHSNPASGSSPARSSTSGSSSAGSSAAISPADELVIYDKNKVVFRMKPVPAKNQASADAAQIPSTKNSPRAASGPAAGSAHSPASNTQTASRAIWLAPSQAENRLMSRVEPQYPADALAAHRSGNVTLEVHVAADGTVAAVRTLNGDPLLAAAAEQAVRGWRYQPYRPNEKASPFQTDVTLTFSLPN